MERRIEEDGPAGPVVLKRVRATHRSTDAIEADYEERVRLYTADEVDAHARGGGVRAARRAARRLRRHAVRPRRPPAHSRGPAQAVNGVEGSVRFERLMPDRAPAAGAFPEALRAGEGAACGFLPAIPRSDEAWQAALLDAAEASAPVPDALAEALAGRQRLLGAGPRSEAAARGAGAPRHGRRRGGPAAGPAGRPASRLPQGRRGRQPGPPARRRGRGARRARVLARLRGSRPRRGESGDPPRSRGSTPAAEARPPGRWSQPDAPARSMPPRWRSSGPRWPPCSPTPIVPARRWRFWTSSRETTSRPGACARSRGSSETPASSSSSRRSSCPTPATRSRSSSSARPPSPTRCASPDGP